ncbi:hypothetical protein [Pseudactinotalea suaedae]|uniref:hypothetical protein n=1 Tax=Pseudactinotalea suaedae TaxID=1524924 RepID=UPI0012E189FE|nr:hypothetical protein [Pseudactinotalea suaedae]
MLGTGIVQGVVDEGAVPAASSLPDVPAGAEVISQEKRCGSGDCWWELRLHTVDGQSPAELAAAMGLDEAQRLPGTWLDPRVAHLSSNVREDELHVYLGYADPFP